MDKKKLRQKNTEENSFLPKKSLYIYLTLYFIALFQVTSKH